MRSRARRRKRKQALANNLRNWNAGFELAFMRDRILEMMCDDYCHIMAGDTSAILYKAVRDIDKALSVMAKRMSPSFPELSGRPMWFTYSKRAKFRQTMQWSAHRYGSFIKFDEAAIAEIVKRNPL